MRSPQISVVLVVKNALPLVVGTLDSLRRQTLKDFDVVVVDGASTDGTLQVLHEAAKELPLRIVSEPDRSLAEALAKGLRRATGDIVGMLSADERYYPNTLEQVAKWFEGEPDAVVCSGRLDFIDEHDKVVDSLLTSPFNLSAHLACEVTPSILTCFFNRRIIGEDFRYDAEAPTCPDYEFGAQLGFRFPASAFKRFDVSVAQAYRTRDSMSFRAESFAQFCRDKLTHLNNLLAKGYAGPDQEALRRRASAGIHMWAAEQLSYIEHGHPNILAHCAEAAQYDKAYDRIGRFIATTGNARYDDITGTVNRTIADRPSPRAVSIAEFKPSPPPSYWAGAALVMGSPLTLRTSSSSWGFSMEFKIAKDDFTANRTSSSSGQYWARLDLEVIEGCVEVSVFTPSQDLIGKMIFRQSDGRALALIPLPTGIEPALMVRSGGHPSSVVRFYQADLLRDPDAVPALVAPI